MIKIYTGYQEIDAAKWDNLVRISKTASFFQTRECYQFFESLSFLRPFVFAVEEDGELVGLLCGYVIADGNFIKQFFSKRAIVPGGVLLSDGICAEAINQLLKTVQLELAHKAIYIEVRNYNDYSLYRADIVQSGFEYIPHLNFHVVTPDSETTLANLSSSKRRQIKQTLKAGVTVVKAQQYHAKNMDKQSYVTTLFQTV